MNIFSPSTEEETGEVVRAALAGEQTLDIIGGGTRSGLGRPSSADIAVSTRGLSGVRFYEPAELVLAAGAGTPLVTINEMLDEQQQELAFEPVDHAVLYGGSPQSGTLGGLIAVNASGPRRIKAGAARDHLLGFRAINGRGEVFKSGGRVMKNVTGYDMCKLMAGSHGTFGILSEITLKVLPRAETEQTVVLVGLDDGEAVEVMTTVSGTGYEVSGFAHIPATGEGFSSPVPASLSDHAVTALRLEGPERPVQVRRRELVEFLAGPGRQIETVDHGPSRELWTGIRDVLPMSGQEDQVWRISTAPTKGALLVRDLVREEVPVTYHYYDRAGGLIWLAVAPAADAHADVVRRLVDRHGGHATLVRAADDVRARVPVFHPQSPALAALTKRLRESFDPHLILNRGRIRSDL